jgi:hypothetical protein
MPTLFENEQKMSGLDVHEFLDSQAPFALHVDHAHAMLEINPPASTNKNWLVVLTV